MKRTLLALSLLLVCLTVSAAQDYVFERYDLVMDVALDNSFAVDETILVNFSQPRHGIYREIPVSFGRIRVKVDNLTANVPVTRDSVSSDWLTLRLGSADRTVRGLVEYQLGYTYAIGDDRNEEYDEFYYNIVGPGWEAPFGEVTFTITFPEPVDTSMVFLTGGTYGSTAQRGNFGISPDRRTIAGRAENLMPGEALTLRVQLPEGYFSAVKPFVDYTPLMTAIALAVALAVAVHAFMLFRRYGREELFIPVVRFDPPEGLSPLEVGYLVDGVVDNKDVTSLLFYWADRGYLTIEEKGKRDFLFTKLKELDTDKSYEKALFDAFFASGDGSSVTLKQLEKGRFAEALVKARPNVIAYFKGERLLKDQKAEKMRIIPMLYGALVIILNAVALTINYIGGMTIPFVVVGFISLGLAMGVSGRLSATWVTSSMAKKIVSIFLLGVVCFFMVGLSTIFGIIADHGVLYALTMSIAVVLLPVYFGTMMVLTAKRSPYAQKKLEEIVGYREFISKVEMDKLKMLIDSDPALFYHVLGYAIVLGLEDVWARKFANIAVAQPSWYVGANPVRDALFYSALSHRVHASVMENVIYKQAGSGPSSPIRSSFGSSGFSGGGFGGGGGGAW